MSKEDHSSFVLQGFEPSAVRLKRKLRLILNKNLRRDKLNEKNVTLVEFILYTILLLTVTVVSFLMHYSQDVFNADKCIRRLLVNKLQLYEIKEMYQVWEYLEKLNEELYANTIQLQTRKNESKEQLTHQLLLSGENFILGLPRLRQIRVDDVHCTVTTDLSIRPIRCYAPYEKSIEYRQTFRSNTGVQYEYTPSEATAALQLSNIYGPYSSGGFIYSYHKTKNSNDNAIANLKNNGWLDLSTRALFIEFIYFNPNTELLTSINILFEFLTTGTIQVKDFFHTVPINSFFIGRDKLLGFFQVFFIMFYVIFTFYYVGKLAGHRLWFVLSSYWNLYDFCLLILITVQIYFDIHYLLHISDALKCFSTLKTNVFNDFIHFIETQIIRIDLQAYVSAACFIRLLRYLPHLSRLIANQLDVFFKSIRNSLGFLFLFFLIFMSFVIYATFLYGDELYEFHTFALTSYTLIHCTLGQFEYDRAYRVSPTWTPVFYMVYVCVIFFILLNLLVAVVNEAYILGKQELKQIENDLQEEYIHESKTEDLSAFHRSQRPRLQAEFIRYIDRFLMFFFNKSIGNEMNADLEVDDDVSLSERQHMIIDKLRKHLLNDGFNEKVVEQFIQRLLLKKSVNDDGDDDENDLFLFQMEVNKAVKLLSGEFKIFNNQYEKLAQDWQKTALSSREMILANSIDIEQASIMKQHLDILKKRVDNFESLIPKALDHTVELYDNHFSTD